MKHDFVFQIRVWEAAWTGDHLEISALHAESRDPINPYLGWDLNAEQLACIQVSYNTHDEPQQAPYRYALPHITGWLVYKGGNVMSQRELEKQVFGLVSPIATDIVGAIGVPVPYSSLMLYLASRLVRERVNDLSSSRIACGAINHGIATGKLSFRFGNLTLENV